MGRAIIIAGVIVLFSFGFVLVQLRRRAGGVPPGRAGAPVLITRDDGSVYAVSLRLDRFEQRLVDEEKRSARLTADLDAAREERDRLRKQVTDLEDNRRRWREQSTPPPAGGLPGMPGPLGPTDPAAPGAPGSPGQPGTPPGGTAGGQ